MASRGARPCFFKRLFLPPRCCIRTSRQAFRHLFLSLQRTVTFVAIAINGTPCTSLNAPHYSLVDDQVFLGFTGNLIPHLHRDTRTYAISVRVKNRREIKQLAIFEDISIACVPLFLLLTKFYVVRRFARNRFVRVPKAKKKEKILVTRVARSSTPKRKLPPCSTVLASIAVRRRILRAASVPIWRRTVRFRPRRGNRTPETENPGNRR